jgi:lipopolysaccharide biosynthesis glycosyltransferase
MADSNSENYLNLAYCGNSATFDGFLISSLSAARVCKQPLRIYFLTGDFTDLEARFTPFTEEQRLFAESALKKHNFKNRVILLQTQDIFRQLMGKSVNLRTKYTPYTLMRLVMDKLPEMPDRVLYLDTDTIVCSSLDPFFNMEMGVSDVAIAPDQVGKHFFGRRYGNAGVLLLNIGQIKKDGCFDKTRDIVNNRKMFMPDQTALNVVTKKNKIIIPQNYNEQLTLHEDTVIRHYNKRLYWWPYIHTVNIKPWQVKAFKKQFRYHTHDELLDEYVSLKKDYERQFKH